MSAVLGLGGIDALFLSDAHLGGQFLGRLAGVLGGADRTVVSAVAHQNGELQAGAAAAIAGRHAVVGLDGLHVVCSVAFVSAFIVIQQIAHCKRFFVIRQFVYTSSHGRTEARAWTPANTSR